MSATHVKRIIFVRPQNESELKEEAAPCLVIGSVSNAQNEDASQIISLINPRDQSISEFRFYTAYWSAHDTSILSQDVRTYVLANAQRVYSTAVILHGAGHTGKSYVLLGSPKHRGLLFSTLTELFVTLTPGARLFLSLYQVDDVEDQIFDLLQEDATWSADTVAPSELYIESLNDAAQVMKQAMSRRHGAVHTFFTIKLAVDKAACFMDFVLLANIEQSDVEQLRPSFVALQKTLDVITGVGVPRGEPDPFDACALTRRFKQRSLSGKLRVILLSSVGPASTAFETSQLVLRLCSTEHINPAAQTIRNVQVPLRRPDKTVISKLREPESGVRASPGQVQRRLGGDGEARSDMVRPLSSRRWKAHVGPLDKEEVGAEEEEVEEEGDAEDEKAREPLGEADEEGVVESEITSGGHEVSPRRKKSRRKKGSRRKSNKKKKGTSDDSGEDQRSRQHKSRARRRGKSRKKDDDLSADDSEENSESERAKSSVKHSQGSHRKAGHHISTPPPPPATQFATSPLGYRRAFSPTQDGAVDGTVDEFSLLYDCIFKLTQLLEDYENGLVPPGVTPGIGIIVPKFSSLPETRIQALTRCVKKVDAFRASNKAMRRPSPMQPNRAVHKSQPTPIHHEPATPPVIIKPEPVPRQRRRRKKAPIVPNVLLVEDIQLSQLVAGQMLKRGQFQVVKATNGETCVELYKQHHETLEVVLMDVSLGGGISGLEATQQIRVYEAEMELEPVQILGLTSNYAPDDLKAYEAAGMNGCISKGGKSDLADMVKRALEEPSGTFINFCDGTASKSKGQAPSPRVVLGAGRQAERATVDIDGSLEAIRHHMSPQSEEFPAAGDEEELRNNVMIRAAQATLQLNSPVVVEPAKIAEPRRPTRTKFQPRPKFDLSCLSAPPPSGAVAAVPNGSSSSYMGVGLDSPGSDVEEASAVDLHRAALKHGMKKEAPPKSAKPKPESMQTRRVKSRAPPTVLLVEDVKVSQRLAQGALKREHFKSILAENGEQAAEKYKRHYKSLQLVLMDIHLGPTSISGMEATVLIRAFEREQGCAPCTILGCTGNVKNINLQAYRQAGLNGCIGKGLVLGDMVKKALQQLEANPDEFVDLTSYKASF